MHTHTFRKKNISSPENNWKTFYRLFLLPRPLCFFSFCSLSLSKGKLAMSKQYTERASTAVSESMMLAHSVTSSSQQVREESTASSSSQSSREINTQRFARTHATIIVWMQEEANEQRAKIKIQIDSEQMW